MNKIPLRHYKISTNNLERKLVNSHDVNTIVHGFFFQLSTFLSNNYRQIRKITILGSVSRIREIIK